MLIFTHCDAEICKSNDTAQNIYNGDLIKITLDERPQGTLCKLKDMLAQSCHSEDE